MRLSSSSCFKEEEAKRNRCGLFNKTILVHCQIQIIRLWSLNFQPVNNLLPWPPLCWPAVFVNSAAVLSPRSLNLCIHTGKTINRSSTRRTVWPSKEHFMCRKRCGSSWSQRGNCEEFLVQPAATVLCRACVTWQQSVCVCVWVGTCLARCHPSGPKQLFYQHFQSFLDVNSLTSFTRHSCQRIIASIRL